MLTKKFLKSFCFILGPGCQMAGFLTVFASELSIFTLTVITMERWFAITYAIHLNKRLRLGVAARVMVLGWMFALTLAALPLFGASSYSKTSICLPFEKSDVTDVAYLLTLLAINGLAFILICIFYGKMYWSISGHNSTVTQSDKTVAKRMALLVFTDFACWAPIAFFGLTAVAGYPLINVTNSKILLVFFYPLNSCANPFLYAIFTKQYRRDLLVIMNRFGLIASGQAEGKFKTTYSANLPYGGGRRTTTPCPDDRCRFHRHGSSTLTQVSSLDNSRHSNKRKSCSSADVTTTPTGTPPSPIKRRSRENGCCGLMCDEENCNGGGGDRKASTDTSSRRLSVVRENSHTSEEEMPSEKSSEAAMTAAMGGRTTAPAISPKHRGSPHPIKNSYMKLSSSSEHELILRKLAAANSSSTSPRSSGKWTGRRKSSAEVIPLRHHQNIDKIFI